MAEERRDREARQADAPQTAAAPVVVKKKKRSKAGMFFILLLLAAGVGTGLHFSGLWDARPLVWSIVPQLPYVGEPISNFFEIPEQYTLTVAERRAYELDERQRYLDEVERRLQEQAELNASSDISPAPVPAPDQAPQTQPSAPQQPAPQEDEQQQIRQLVSTMQEMSPRNAAMILEEQQESLAVNLLQKLPTDSRSSILAKMDPKKAARLTEMMAASQSQ